MRFLQFIAETVKLTVSATLAFLVFWIVATSGWHYALVDGEEKRCFSVRLPGYEEYTDWEHGLAIRQRFSLRALYRLGPWIDPEWIEHPEGILPEDDE